MKGLKKNYYLTIPICGNATKQTRGMHEKINKRAYKPNASLYCASRVTTFIQPTSQNSRHSVR